MRGGLCWRFIRAGKWSGICFQIKKVDHVHRFSFCLHLIVDIDFYLCQPSSCFDAGQESYKFLSTTLTHSSKMPIR